jgi:phage gp36-like protein
VELFLRFRSSFVGELAGVARRRHLDTREATALLVEAESAMDRLLVALMHGYERHGAGG